MRHRQRTQNALSVVSYIFLFVGLIALIEMIRHAVKGEVRFNFGILGIGIFAGLRRYSRIWRICALLFTWYGIAALCWALFACLYSQPVSTTSAYLDQQFSSISSIWLAIPLLMVLMVTLWQLRVLMHPAIRRLFEDEPHPATAVAQSAPVGPEIDGVILK